MSIIGHSRSWQCHRNGRKRRKESQEKQKEGKKGREVGAWRNRVQGYPLVKSKCILFTGEEGQKHEQDPVALFNVEGNPEGREQSARFRFNTLSLLTIVPALE